MQGDVSVLDLAQLWNRVYDFDQRRLGLVVQRQRVIEIVAFDGRIMIRGVAFRRQNRRKRRWRHCIVCGDVRSKKSRFDVAEAMRRTGKPVICDAGISAARNDIWRHFVALQRLLRSRIYLELKNKRSI